MSPRGQTGQRICVASASEAEPPGGTLRFPAPTLLQISRMTIIKASTSYFACASFATTSATLSSIWFQPSS